MSQFVTRRSQIPGSRFTPTNLELINLLRRKKDRGKSSSFITDMDVYQKEPWRLKHVRHFRSRTNEWFYFVTRNNKKEKSKKRSRTVAGFTWKNNGPISIDDKDGVCVGYMRNLAFSLDRISTGWVMHEFFLDRSGSDKVVLCRIRFNPRKYNAQYAPRHESTVIGQPQPPREEAALEDGLTLVEKKKNNLYVVADVPIDTYQGMEQQQQQWTRSCSSEYVSYLSVQRQQFMRPYSNHAMNGDMEQHQDFGSCRQLLGAQQQNWFWGQETDPSRSAQAMEAQQWNGYYDQVVQCSDHPYHQGMVPVTRGMMEHQDFAFYASKWLGGDLAQNHHSVFPLETQQGKVPQQQQNSCFDSNVVENLAARQQQQYLRHNSNFSVTQPGMMEHQDFAFYAPQGLGGDLAQNHHSVVPMETQQGMEPQQQKNSCFDSNVVENLAARQQQQYLRHNSNFSVTQPGMMEHQDFGFYAPQGLGGDLAQNHHSVVPLETQQGKVPQQQQQNSCFDSNVVENLIAQQQQQYLIQDSNFSVTQLGMMEHQEFGSSAQTSGGDMAQNHLLVVPLETQQGMEPKQQENSCFDHSAVENQTTEPPYLTQGQKQHCEQATDLPINQGIDEPHRSTASSFSHNELLQLCLGEMDELANYGNGEWAQDLGDMDDIANFGNAEWVQQLGENTPEEEAELQAELGSCRTTASLFNYFCPM